VPSPSSPGCKHVRVYDYDRKCSVVIKTAGLVYQGAWRQTASREAALALDSDSDNNSVELCKGYGAIVELTRVLRWRLLQEELCE
jgi:hypothetical protein